MEKKQVSIDDSQLNALLAHGSVLCRPGCKQHGRHAVKVTLDPHTYDPWMILFCRGHYASSIDINRCIREKRYESFDGKKSVDLSEFPQLLDAFTKLRDNVASAIDKPPAKISFD